MAQREQPIASVIVLAYNDKKYLEACLSSLLDQDMPPGSYEVILADNASTDGSAEFAEERFPSVRVLRLGKNWGFAEGNNHAAAQARGRYIGFQNPDTIAHRRWLPELIAAIESDPQVKACHPAGLPLNFGGYNEREGALDRGVMCDLTRFGYVDFTEMPLNGNRQTVPTLHLAGGSFLLDPEILPDLRYYFDPTYFMYNEDTDLGLRITNLGYKVLFVPSAAAYHERAPSRRSQLNKKGLRMAYLVTRNRFITFYKNMFWTEFLLMVPLASLASIVKLRTMPLTNGKRLLYALGLIPFTLFCLAAAVVHLPRHAENRRYILSRRPHERMWLFREVWRRRVPAPTPLAGGIDR